MKYLLAFFVLVFASCVKNNEVENHTGKYKLNLKSQIVAPLSDLFLITKVVKLETEGESLLNAIDKVIVRKDRIYLHSLNSNVKVFSDQGKYLNSIGTKGRAPNEFIMASDFDLSPGGEKVAIWDRDGAKMLIYNKEGAYEKSVRSKQVKWSFNFSWLSSDRFLLSSLYIPQESVNGRFQAYIVDGELNIIKGIIPYDDRFERLLIMGNPFSKQDNGNVLFRHPIEGDVYEIGNDSKKKYELCLGKYELKDDRKQEYIENSNAWRQDYFSSNYALLWKVYDLVDYIYCQYQYETKTYGIIIRKAGDLQRRYRFGNAFDFLSSIKIIGKFNDNLIAYVEPYEIKENIQKLSGVQRINYKDYVEYWENIVKDKSDTDNPILVFLKPKPF